VLLLAIGVGLVAAAGVYFLTRSANQKRKPKSFWDKLAGEYLPKKLRDAL
jgi:hypothetical protein